MFIDLKRVIKIIILLTRYLAPYYTSVYATNNN